MGYFAVFSKNGVVSGSKKGDFIGLIRFWAKNEGKNEQKLALFCTFLSKIDRFLHLFAENEWVLSRFFDYHFGGR